MRRLKSKIIYILFGIALTFCISALILLIPNVRRANAAEDKSLTSEYVVLDVGDDIAAEYYFTPISDTECEVAITNYETATEAVIPKTAEINGKTYTVTQIASSGFGECERLIRVSMPSTVKKIKDSAFARCPELTAVSLANVEEIEDSAFMRCPKLTTIVIPESVTNLGAEVFRRNNTQIEVRGSSAGANWQSDWNDGNENQDIHYASTYIEPLLLKPVYEGIVLAEYYFYPVNDTECAVTITNYETATQAIIPSTAIINGKEYIVTEIAPSGFGGSEKLVKVNLPSTIKKIGESAFARCNELTYISLYNVEEIGENAFMRCPKLATLVLPKSVKTVGSEVFRKSNTQVKVRASFEETDWANDWNSGNTQQKVEYSSVSAEPSSPVENTNELIGYSLAERQTRTDNFYKEYIDDNILVPNMYNGLPVLGIPKYAFEDANFDQLIVEYYEEPIIISSNAFSDSYGNSIVINRSISFETGAKSIFASSTVASVVFPSSISCFTKEMFNGCKKLTNIYFIEPKSMAWTEELNIASTAKAALEAEKNIDNATGIIYLPNSVTFEAIGENAFRNTTAIKELHIYESIKTLSKNFLLNWDNEKQEVHVHNENPIIFVGDDVSIGWNYMCFANFDNVVYDNLFYDITFNVDDNTSLFEPKTVRYGSSIGTLPVPTHDQYMFGGWFTAEGELFTENTVYKTKGNITLYARWKQIIYLDFQGGTGGTSEVYAYDSQPMPDEDLIAPTLYDKTFLGYFSGKNGSGTKYYEPNGENGLKACENVIWRFTDSSVNTLYAAWEQAKYHITYDLGDVYVGYILAYNNSENPDTITSIETVTLKEPTRKGYLFEGWYLDGAKVETLTNIYNPITLTAKWIGTEVIVAAKQRIDMTATYSIVNFSTYVTNIEYTVTATGPVKQLYIYGGSHVKANVTLNIVLNTTCECSLVLDNISITSSVGKNAIFVNSDETVHLYAYKAYINGANGNSSSENGATAILCKNIEIHTAVNIVGGNGIYATTMGTGGHGIQLRSGGTLTISSDNITIRGGNGYDDSSILVLKMGYGYAVKGSNIVYNGSFSNVVLQNGKVLN